MTSTNNNMRIEQVKSAPREQRVAAHSHIKGLGLNEDGTAVHTLGGFVGQEQAREVKKRKKKTNQNYESFFYRL